MNATKEVVLQYKIDETWNCLGMDRLKDIHEIGLAVIEVNLGLSYNLAISGAMRWPPGLRPEVLVKTTVDFN